MFGWLGGYIIKEQFQNQEKKQKQFHAALAETHWKSLGIMDQLC